jgi:hypothetical protein
MEYSFISTIQWSTHNQTNSGADIIVIIQQITDYIHNVNVLVILEQGAIMLHCLTANNGFIIKCRLYRVKCIDDRDLLAQLVTVFPPLELKKETSDFIPHSPSIFRG